MVNENSEEDGIVADKHIGKKPARYSFRERLQTAKKEGTITKKQGAKRPGTQSTFFGLLCMATLVVLQRTTMSSMLRVPPESDDPKTLPNNSRISSLQSEQETAVEARRK